MDSAQDQQSIPQGNHLAQIAVSQPPQSQSDVSSGNVKQKLNFKTVYIVLVVITAVVGVYLGAFIFSKQDSSKKQITALMPSLSPASKSESSSQPTINISSNEGSNSKEKETTLKTIDFIKKSLQCQYDIDKKYPDSLGLISQNCVPPADFKPPEIAKNADSWNYTSTNGGQGYYFEMPIAAGEGYIVTEKNTEYVIVPKDLQTELLSKNRDETRIYDLNNLNDLIYRVSISAKSQDNTILCNKLSDSCTGDTRSSEVARTDGAGWIKINFNEIQGVSIQRLVTDSLNNEAYHYVYCADKGEWEINAVLESKSHSEDMRKDKGDDDNKYEIGSNLKLINNISTCKY